MPCCACSLRGHLQCHCLSRIRIPQREITQHQLKTSNVQGRTNSHFVHTPIPCIGGCSHAHSCRFSYKLKSRNTRNRFKKINAHRLLQNYCELFLLLSASHRCTSASLCASFLRSASTSRNTRARKTRARKVHNDKMLIHTGRLVVKYCVYILSAADGADSTKVMGTTQSLILIVEHCS